MIAFTTANHDQKMTRRFFKLFSERSFLVLVLAALADGAAGGVGTLALGAGSHCYESCW